MGQIFKYGMVAAAIAAAGLAAADQGTDTLPTPQFFVEIVGPDTAGTTTQVAMPQPEARAARPAPRPARASNGERYGPVGANDTLWSVAKGISATQPVSIYQTMVALYQRNPTAFKNGNINLLRGGSYLDVPSVRDIRSIDPKTAAARFAALQRGETSPAEPPKRTIKPAVPKPAAIAAAPVNKADKPQPVPAAERPGPAKPEEVATAAPDSSGTPESAELEAKVNAAVPGLALDQRQQLADLRALADQLSGSSEQLLTLAEANHRLKLRLQALSEEVAALRDLLEEDRASQAQLLASLSPQGASQPSGLAPDGLLAQLGNPLTLIAAGVVSVLSVLLGILLWLRKRSRSSDDQALEDASLQESEVKGPFDELVTVDDDAQMQSSEASKDEPAVVRGVSLDDSAADNDAVIDEALFGLDEQMVTGKATAPTEDDSGPAILADGTDSGNAFQSGASDAQSASDEERGDADLPAARETMLADDGGSVDAAAGSMAADEDESGDLSAAWEKMLADNGGPADAAADKVTADDEDESEDLSVAWEKMLADDGEQVDNADGDRLADEGEELTAAWEQMPTDDSDLDTDADAAPADAAKPYPQSEVPLASEAPAEARRRPAERDSASETERQLRQSLSLEADVAEDKESAPGTLEQQFIDKAPASEVDDLFAGFARDAFTEQEAGAAGDDAATDAGFIDIEKLLAESDEYDKEQEPYDDIHLDVGLDGFPEIMPADTGDVDVDADGGVAAKLDLARAYMEIDDGESARVLIGEVLEEGDDKLKLEAQKLLKHLG